MVVMETVVMGEEVFLVDGDMVVVMVLEDMGVEDMVVMVMEDMVGMVVMMKWE